jgi:chaperone modulatory protein CbpM
MTTIDLEVFLRDSGIELRVLEHWVERAWIVPERTDPGLALTEADAARCLFIRDLQADFGVNEEGVDVVLHLVDQVHGLRRALLALREWP